MKGLDENIIKAEKVNNLEKCEGLCDDEKDCWAFRYLSKSSFCFVYNSKHHIEDDVHDVSESVIRCVACYMNTTKNAKGRDDEIEPISIEFSLNKCENKCIKSDECRGVHFDGKRCFKFKNEVVSYEKTGIDFSRKIWVHYLD